MIETLVNWREKTPGELAYEAYTWAEYDDGDLDHDYTWALELFPVSEIERDWTPANWRSWMERERHMLDLDGTPDRYQSIEHWPDHPDDDPVCIVERPDGTWALWDGWHRTATAVEKGRETVPAIVGRRRR